MNVHPPSRWSRLLARALPQVPVVATAVVSVGVFALLTEQSPIAPARSIRRDLLMVAPEGWGFFTRDPREERTHIWQHELGQGRRSRQARGPPPHARDLGLTVWAATRVISG